jgi:hypothetical protein
MPTLFDPLVLLASALKPTAELLASDDFPVFHWRHDARVS